MGPERKLWILNEELLYDEVPNIKSISKGGTKRTKENIIELPEETPAAFGKFVTWLYGGGVTCRICDDKQEAEMVEPADEEHQFLWCSVWILAEKLALWDFAEQVKDRLQVCWTVGGPDQTVPSFIVLFSYKNTLPPSDLRDIVAEEVLWRYCSQKKTSGHSDLIVDSMKESKEFAKDLLGKIEEHFSLGKCNWDSFDCFFHCDVRMKQSVVSKA